eukprot:4746602-Ditylum_brightwellii.AAC.1
MEDGRKAKTDEENAQVFAKHFNKLFDNQSPLSCNPTALDLIDQLPDFLHLADSISLCKVHAAWQRMANGKATGPSGITSDVPKSMMWKDNSLEEEDHANDDADFLSSVIHDLLTDLGEQAQL